MKVYKAVHGNENKCKELHKEMNLKEKLPAMTEEEQLALLGTNGMLVKRPLIIADDFILVGFKEKEWQSHLIK